MDRYITNYMQILAMTKEERFEMYMRCTKEELASMLTERDEVEQRVVSMFRVISPGEWVEEEN